MKEFWVIDTKCTVSPSSDLPQDGSDYYFGRSVVPALSKDAAIEALKKEMSEQGIELCKLLNAVRYEDGDWSDDDHMVVESYEEARSSNEIDFGCFVSEKSKKKGA